MEDHRGNTLQICTASSSSILARQPQTGLCLNNLFPYYPIPGYHSPFFDLQYLHISLYLARTPSSAPYVPTILGNLLLLFILCLALGILRTVWNWNFSTTSHAVKSFFQNGSPDRYCNGVASTFQSHRLKLVDKNFVTETNILLLWIGHMIWGFYLLDGFFFYNIFRPI